MRHGDDLSLFSFCTEKRRGAEGQVTRKKGERREERVRSGKEWVREMEG